MAEKKYKALITNQQFETLTQRVDTIESCIGKISNRVKI